MAHEQLPLRLCSLQGRGGASNSTGLYMLRRDPVNPRQTVGQLVNPPRGFCYAKSAVTVRQRTLTIALGELSPSEMSMSDVLLQSFVEKQRASPA